MEKGVIFVCGVYGVGKDTLCRKVKEKIGIPFYSAGDLISAENGEIYGRNKRVSDVDSNQEILINSISKRLREGSFILAGHMCILESQGNIAKISLDQFIQMNIRSMILLEADDGTVHDNMVKRDGVSYSMSFIKELSKTEKMQFELLSERLGLSPHCINMSFSETDETVLIQYLKEDGII